jgi:hypothetical protein
MMKNADDVAISKTTILRIPYSAASVCRNGILAINFDD